MAEPLGRVPAVGEAGWPAWVAGAARPETSAPPATASDPRVTARRDKPRRSTDPLPLPGLSQASVGAPFPHPPTYHPRRYPFIAPAIKPRVKARWRRKKKTSAGRQVRTPAAMMYPHSVVN